MPPELERQSAFRVEEPPEATDEGEALRVQLGLLEQVTLSVPSLAIST
jgi:hypothetical protein